METRTIQELEADLARVTAAMVGAKADIQMTWQQVDAAQAHLRSLFSPMPPADQLSAGMARRYFEKGDAKFQPAADAIHAANVPYQAARDRYQRLRQLHTNLHGQIGQLRDREADLTARQLSVERLLAGHAPKPGRLAQLRASIASNSADAPSDDVATRAAARAARTIRAREQRAVQ